MNLKKGKVMSVQECIQFERYQNELTRLKKTSEEYTLAEFLSGKKKKPALIPSP